MKLFGLAAAGSVVAYSFPSIIVPQNIVTPETAPEIFTHYNLATHSWSASDLMAAQREFIENAIQAIHEQESDFLRRFALCASTEMTNFRGRREPLEIGGTL